MGQYILLFVIVGLIGGVMYVLYTSGLMRYSFMPIMLVFTYGFMFFRMNNGAGNKMRLHLKGADRDEALRRMYGRVPTDIIRWRLYTTSRTVQRRVQQLGLTQHKEP